MKILIKGLKKTGTELKLLYFTSFIVSLLVIIPICNFLLEGISYIINGNFNLRHNDDCKLHECLGNTTVRRRVLSKSKRQNSKTQKARMSRTPLELTPTSESVKYTPREHSEMQQVMRRPFEKHSQRSIVWLTIWVQSRRYQLALLR